jgi:hypothetical protein
MLMYETYIGTKAVITATFKTPKFESTETIEDVVQNKEKIKNEAKNYIIIGSIIGAVGLILIAATIIGLIIYHKYGKTFLDSKITGFLFF